MYLVLIIGKQKEGIGQISALLNRFETEKVIILKDQSVTDFPSNDLSEIIDLDLDADLISLREEMTKKLFPHLSKEFEVALSMASGTGKEHMALLSALLSLPVGVKVVAYTKNGIEYLS